LTPPPNQKNEGKIRRKIITTPQEKENKLKEGSKIENKLVITIKKLSRQRIKGSS